MKISTHQPSGLSAPGLRSPSLFRPLLFTPGLSNPSLWLAAALVASSLLFSSPALAHHFADLGQMKPTWSNGVISGLAHPLLGPDHLVFLLALSLVALQRRWGWALGLLLVGLLGGAAGLAWPGLPGAEALVACTLVVEALVLLRRLPPVLLLPAMALHGYVLSVSVFGWSTMPVAAYGAGLLLSQGSLLLVQLFQCHRNPKAGFNNLRLLAGLGRVSRQPFNVLPGRQRGAVMTLLVITPALAEQTL